MEGNIITMQEIFLFEQTGVDQNGTVKGVFKGTGILPKFVERFRTAGVNLPEDLFSKLRIVKGRP